MAELDKIIHEPARLRIMASLVTLDPGEQVNFVYLRGLLKLTNGNLGAHLAKLEKEEIFISSSFHHYKKEDYIKLRKSFIARKPRTFVTTTGKGRDAFDKHVADLKQIIENS